MVGSAHPTGLTRLKLWVKRSLKILLIVFFKVLNAHNFSLVEPLQSSSVPRRKKRNKTKSAEKEIYSFRVERQYNKQPSKANPQIDSHCEANAKRAANQTNKTLRWGVRGGASRPSVGDLGVLTPRSGFPQHQ
jgi:hypothetical protein